MGQGEGVGAGKQGVDGVDKGGVAAVVLAEGVAVGGGDGVGGGEVGVDVCAAKAVYGLFGVANHVEGGFGVLMFVFRLCIFRLPFGVHKGGFEDGVLQGVGVLEFVDEGGLPVGG